MDKCPHKPPIPSLLNFIHPLRACPPWRVAALPVYADAGGASFRHSFAAGPQFLIDTSTIRNALNPFICNTEVRSNR
jgi:hypothetical protein